MRTWLIAIGLMVIAGCSSTTADQSAVPAGTAEELAEPSTATTSTTAASTTAAAPTTSDQVESLDLDVGLIGHFPLDGDSTDALGVTPSSIEGATGTADRNGIEGAALRFDGLDDVVEFEPADALNVERDFSISIWVEAGDLDNDWYSLFEKSDPERGGHSRYGLWLFANTLAVCFEQVDNLAQPCLQSGPLDLTGWRHMAAVRSNDEMTLFLDGEEVARQEVTTSPVSQTNFSAYIGNDQYQPGAPWLDASVDELRIYDRALSRVEVAELATA